MFMFRKNKIIKIVISFIILFTIVGTFLFTYIKSINHIRDIAYYHVQQNLPEGQVKSIINWKEAKVKNVKITSDRHLIKFGMRNDEIIANDQDAYMISFDVAKSLLGPITVYLDKKTKELIGFEDRE